MKEEKPYIEILRGQLKGAELSLEDAYEGLQKAQTHYAESVIYRNMCKERYGNMLNDLNQNTKNGN